MAASDEPCCEPMFWLYLLICICLVLFAGLMSGLTLGLMSLSLVDLEVLIKAGQPQDRRNAAKILPVVKNQHLLLCTLLIGNSLAMEALPIFLDALVPAWGAVLTSVTLILAFGEIIPQAVCSRYGLKVGAKLAVVVRILLLLFFPVSYPISKLLDWLLGKGHFALLRRAELKTLVNMHGNEAGKGGELTHDETTIITGALDLTQKTAKDAMTPISATFSLDINSKLDMHTMGLIITKGHSRVPIYSGHPLNIIGIILVKNLITCRPEDETPIQNVTVRKIPRVSDHLPLYEILNEFQKGHSHMAVVVKGTRDVDGTQESAKGSVSMSGNWGHLNAKSKQVDEKGTTTDQGDGSPMVLEEQVSVATHASSLHRVVNGNPRPTLSSIMEQHGDGMHKQPKKRDRGSRDYSLLHVDLESLPSYPLDEEVVGIITMEDVMEELLQEEILDETDEYVDVHNKIRINILPQRRSSPISLFPRRTPVASPLASCHHSPNILRSPVSPYIQVAGPKPMLSASPGKSLGSSPAEHNGPGHNSPASHGVSRKSYEKIRKLDMV